MKKFKLLLIVFLFGVTAAFSQDKKYTTYTVQKGETVFSISKKYSISTQALLSLNPDVKDNIISEGQLLIVPLNKQPERQYTANGDYIEKGMLFHKIQPKENYYRIKKNFGVSKRELRHYNPDLKSTGLRAGDILLIPVKQGYRPTLITKAPTVPTNSDETKPYLVRPKETKFSISRRYGITVADLERLNPHLKENELKIAEIIRVPNTDEIPDPNVQFSSYQVLKGETLYSLSKRFGISQEQMLELNPALKEGVKEGMLIAIPENVENFVNTEFVADIPLHKNLKVAMLLPFGAAKENIDFEKDKAADVVTDFYLGALMAIDSLKRQGLSVSLKVYDTQDKENSISSLIKGNDLKSSDVIVGPLYLENIKLMSQVFRMDSLAIISPVSSKDHGFASRNVIKEVASDELLADKVINYIKKHYEGQHLVVVTDANKDNAPVFDRWIAKINAIDSLSNVTVLKPEKGYIRPDKFRSALDNEGDNWVILLTTDEVVTAEAVNNFGVIREKIKITLFSTNYGPYFEKLSNTFLARLNFHYPTSFYVDYQDPHVKQFVKAYKGTNFTVPGEYAFRGFDVTYDALIRMATYPGYKNAFANGYSQRLASKFVYTSPIVPYTENNGIFLIKYDGLNLQKVE